VGERPVVWLGRKRRLDKDDEALPRPDEAGISVAMIRRMLARLTR
jgi:hypothetical protein